MCTLFAVLRQSSQTLQNTHETSEHGCGKGPWVPAYSVIEMTKELAADGVGQVEHLAVVVARLKQRGDAQEHGVGHGYAAQQPCEHSIVSALSYV